MKITRTQDEIVQRIKDIYDHDDEGWARDVIAAYLTYDNARPFLQPEITEYVYNEHAARAEEFAIDARSVYDFISTTALTLSRLEYSVTLTCGTVQLREYAWLAGHDDVVAAMDARAGMPSAQLRQLAVFGAAFGFDGAPDE